MENRLLDSAFELVSHSLLVQKASIRPPATTAERLDALRRQFRDVEQAALLEALDKAEQLEETAREMADLARGPVNDHTGPPLNELTLSDRCPGFSSASYAWAIQDGYLATR